MFGIETIKGWFGFGKPETPEKVSVGSSIDSGELKRLLLGMAQQYNIPKSELNDIFASIRSSDVDTAKDLVENFLSQKGIDNEEIEDLSIGEIVAKELPGAASTIGNRTLVGIGVGLGAGSLLPGLGTAFGGILGGIVGLLFGAGKAASNVCSKYANVLDYIV